VPSGHRAGHRIGVRLAPPTRAVLLLPSAVGQVRPGLCGLSASCSRSSAAARYGCLKTGTRYDETTACPITPRTSLLDIQAPGMSLQAGVSGSSCLAPLLALAPVLSPVGQVGIDQLGYRSVLWLHVGALRHCVAEPGQLGSSSRLVRQVMVRCARLSVAGSFPTDTHRARQRTVPSFRTIFCLLINRDHLPHRDRDHFAERGCPARPGLQADHLCSPPVGAAPRAWPRAAPR
jgi:hypothetical protein